MVNKLLISIFLFLLVFFATLFFLLLFDVFGEKKQKCIIKKHFFFKNDEDLFRYFCDMCVVENDIKLFLIVERFHHEKITGNESNFYLFLKKQNLTEEELIKWAECFKKNSL